MHGVLYKVLEDTRNSTNPNTCSACGSFIGPTVAITTENYHLTVYQCLQCGAASFSLYQAFSDDALS